MEAKYSQVFCGYGRIVHVADSVVRIWDTYRQTGPTLPESCGVMIGLSSEDRKTLWLADVTTPGTDDELFRFNFKLEDSNHQRRVTRAYKRSNGSQIYVGTWHTHPQETPVPSNVDREDWRQCRQRNPNRPLVFVIVGTLETRLFIKWGTGFRHLKQMEG